MAGCTEILIVTSSIHMESMRKSVGSGENLGIEINYVAQKDALGIVNAIDSARDFIGEDSSLVILGDNIFFGAIGGSFEGLQNSDSARIWVRKVGNPQEYGIITLDTDLKPIQIIEKPRDSRSNLAITGLYYFPRFFVKNLDSVKLSPRNEYEITELLEIYMKQTNLEVINLPRGNTWFDAGTPQRLFEASEFVRIFQERTGEMIGSPEENSYRKNNIDFDEFLSQLKNMPESDYKFCLMQVAREAELR